MDHIICDLLGACVAPTREGEREEGEGDEMECARQRYNLRAFHFTGHRCVEKFMTGFRIDGRTIKRGKLVCISVI